MAQPILKRRLNPFLLISTVAALSLLAGVSVLYQDQINTRTNKIQELNQTAQNLNSSFLEKKAELENRSIKLREYENEISQLKTQKQALNTTIQQKNQEIGDLEDQLEESQQNTQAEQKLEEMNASLQTVCFLGETWSSRDVAVNNCQEWGHQIGSSDES